MSMLSAQDLGIAYVGDVSDLQRATRQASGVVDDFSRKAKGDLKGVSDEAKRTDDGFTRLANGIRSAFVGSSIAVGLITLKNQLVAVTGALTDAQVQLDRLTNGFRFGAGSAEGGAREMAFVRSEADRLGLSLGSTATQYMKMVAASRGSTLAGEKTRDLFKAISEASVVMGMGQDQTERSMAAVVQMMSKGKIMAEELRGQLGEHLPGAFAIAARAMGVTEVELNKLMETGSVLSEDFLPKFAQQLRKELAGSVEQSALSMQANLNRLSTAWLDFKQQLVQGGVGEAIGSQTKALATEISFMGDVLEASRQRGEGFWETMGNAAGAATGRVAFQILQDSANGLNGVLNFTTMGLLDLNTSLDLVPDNLKPVIQQMEITAQKVKQAEAEYAALSARLAQAPDNIYIKSELGNLGRYIATLRLAQSEQRKLMGINDGAGGSIGSVGSGDAALARANRAQYDRQKAAADAAMRKYATPTEKRDEEIKAMKAALGDLFTPELEKRINDSFIKPSKEGSKALKAAAKEASDFAAVYNKINAKETGVDASFYKDLEILKGGYEDGRISVEKYQAAVINLVSTQKVVTEAVKAETDARIAAGVANNAAFDAEFDAIEKKRLATEGQIKTGREMLEQIQFETSLLGLNTLQREQATAMRELERAGVIKGTLAYEAYAEAIKKAMADRDAQQKTLSFWKELDSTAESVFMDLAMNGEDAFKRLGESLKREVIRLLYEMTIKKWIFQIAGISGGGGTGNSLVDLGIQAYQAYTTGSGGGAGGGLAGLFGGGGGGGAASTASTSYAAGTVADSAMISTGSSASAGTSMMGYMSYAALIAAAVMIAENLYSKGYNRAAIGAGGSQRVAFGQHSEYNTDPNIQKSWMNNGLMNLASKDLRKLYDSLGMNEKWADILSGTTRMATLIGRKLGAYGYQANIAGGDADVSGFARYKGGIFRGNTTKTIAIDQRDAAAFDAIVESTIEGSRAMARAMGYSDEAINGYTGSLRVNFKNAKTAEEQAERMAEAMDNLQYELLKTASGGKVAREEFKAFMEGVQKDIEAAGISTQGITDILAGGIVNGLSGEEIGAQLSQNILGGIYTTMAQNTFAPVAAALMQQIITPMFAAMASGIPLAQALNKAALQNVVKMANDAATILNEIFNNEDFRAAMASIGAALGSIGGAAGSIKLPPIRTIKPVNPAVDEARREKEQLEMEILRLQGDTVEIRRRELLLIKPGNRALQERVWALEDEKEILDERRDLERELLELQGDTNALRALERDALHESNRALFDQIKALEDAEKLKDTWSSVIEAMSDEMKRLREEILGATPEGRAYAAAEFAMATAQARAGDAAAADRLPDLARTLVDIASETAGSLSDLRAVQGSTLASLAETQRILGTTFGIEIPKFAVGTNYVPRDMLAMIHEGEAVVPKAFNPAAGGGSQAELVAEIRGLRVDIKAATGLSVGQLAALGRVEQLLDGVTNGGTVMRSREVAL